MVAGVTGREFVLRGGGPHMASYIHEGQELLADDEEIRVRETGGAPVPKPDPFSRVLLMTRICELEEMLRHADEARQTFQAQLQEFALVSGQAAAAMGRMLATGVEDVDVVLSFARQSPDTVVAAAAAELAASPQGREALAQGLRTSAALRAAPVGPKT